MPPLLTNLRRDCMNREKTVSRREKSEFLWGWLFLLPTMTGLIILNIIPIFQTIYQSFFKTGAFGKGNVFIGLVITASFYRTVQSGRLFGIPLSMRLLKCHFPLPSRWCLLFTQWKNKRPFNLEDYLFSADGCCSSSSSYGLEMAL